MARESRAKARERLKRWRAANPEKTFEQQQRQNKRRLDPAVRARKALADGIWRERKKPKKITLEIFDE